MRCLFELAFLFHYRFERIHPFPDGNGRVGRLLMNAILKNNLYHPIIVWDKRREAYFHAFEKAMEGKHDSFLHFMIEQMEQTYQKYITKIQRASDVDMLDQYFSEPSEITT